MRERGLIEEFLAYLAETEVWWLTPLVVSGLLGILMILGATGVTPFVYTLM